MTAVLLLLACAPAIDGIEVQVVDAMPSLVEVRWTTRDDVPSQVRFGADGALDLTTPMDGGGTEHVAVLRGLPQDSDATVQVLTNAGAESESRAVRTGSLGSGLPAFALDGDALDRFTVAPLYDPGDNGGVVILDGQGRTVWRHVDDRGEYVTRARLLRDGSGVVYNSSDLGGDPDVDQTLVWVSWEGEEVRTAPVPLMGHDFVELGDGTVVALVFEPRGDTVGTQLVEIAPDGSQTAVWSAWDCFDPAETSHDEMDLGWTFANALDHDADTGAYLMSFRNFGSIVSVDAATGACDWVLGGLAGTVDITGATTEHQHQFALTDDGILVFDNDGQPGRSRVVEYAPHPATGATEAVWTHEYDAWNVVLGDVHRLDGGETVIVWAMHGEIDRVSPGGERLSTLRTDEGVVVGFVDLPGDLYPED